MSRCGIHMSVRSCSLRGCVALLALVSGACLGEYTIVTSQTTTQPTDAGTDASTSGGGDLGAASGSEGSDAEAGTDTAPCSDCGGSCVDLEGDPEHCGSCEVACGAGESCVDGECRSSCAGGCLEDLEVCVDGACVCRPGLSACADGCFDLESDPARCGACDEACDGIPCGDGLCLNSRAALRVLVVPADVSVPLAPACAGAPLADALVSAAVVDAESSPQGELVVELPPGLYSPYLVGRGGCAPCGDPGGGACAVLVTDGAVATRDLVLDEAAH